MYRTFAILFSIVILAGGGIALAQTVAPSAGTPSSAAKVEDEPEDVTTIHVSNVHCKHCAKRLARKLFTVPGVKRVKASVKKDTAIVYPERDKLPSALKLWEAAEAAKFKVVKIETPTDTYEKKPVELADENVSTNSGSPAKS